MSVDEEKLFIGGLLKDPSKLVHCIGISNSSFNSGACGQVFATLTNLHEKGESTDLLNVHKKSGVALNFLIDLEETGLASSVNFLASEILESGRKKRISKKLNSMIDSLRLDPTAEDVLNELLNIYKSEKGKEKKNPEISKVIDRFKETQHNNRKHGILGVSTCLDVFDEVNINLIQGRLYIIGAYTSIGKTALMVEMLSRMYQVGNPSGILITTEMTEEAIISRMIANQTGINAEVIYSGRMIDKHREIADTIRDNYAAINLRIYDNIKTVEDIESVVRIAEMQGGVDFVFIDFMQNIRKFGCRSKYEESSQIAIDLQNLAKDCKTALVCLSQLTLTQAENDSLAYKGAGELAEAADVGVYLKRSKDDKSRLKVEIKKNRHGPLNEQVMQYVNSWTAIKEVEN